MRSNRLYAFITNRFCNIVVVCTNYLGCVCVCRVSRVGVESRVPSVDYNTITTNYHNDLHLKIRIQLLRCGRVGLCLK